MYSDFQQSKSFEAAEEIFQNSLPAIFSFGNFVSNSEIEQK